MARFLQFHKKEDIHYDIDIVVKVYSLEPSLLVARVWFLGLGYHVPLYLLETGPPPDHKMG